MIAHQYSFVHGKLERSNEDDIIDKYIYKLMPMCWHLNGYLLLKFAHQNLLYISVISQVACC